MRRPAIVNNQEAFQKMSPDGLDDCGWNDMGYDVDPSPNTPMDYDHRPSVNPLANAVPDATPEVKLQQQRIAEQLSLESEDAAILGDGVENQTNIAPNNSQDVNTQETNIEQSYSDNISPLLAKSQKQPAVKSTQPTKLKPEKREKIVREVKPRQKSKGKAAFTLRLDQASHLKLRLACAISNCSAQALVSEALNEKLAAMPEIDSLALQVAAR
ncbi:hypothetical protein LPB140_08400 [Sphingorhabdus lutea]|uniref:Uncharacterized protein n=2 Tax=Sphingorhabdus lutea TaxID=1913578 RepID=A0A1L3JCE9_9SPHN|nr:hypothetical protein LPB140_08400 [Sphingorhabdus lutea]